MSHQDLAIRPFHPTDETALIALWHACGLTRPWNDPRKDIARKLTVQSDLFLVGELDGAIVATLMGGYDGHRGWINYLAVSPLHRRRHFASAQDWVDRLREAGFEDSGHRVLQANDPTLNTLFCFLKPAGAAA